MRQLTYIIFIFAFLVCGAFTVKAQQSDQRKKWEKINKLKIEFVLKKLDLHQAAEEKFVPIYKRYQTEIGQVFHEKRMARNNNKNNPERQVQDDLKLDEKYVNLKKNYLREFQKVLSSSEIKTLYSAEREFKEELMKHLKDHQSK